MTTNISPSLQFFINLSKAKTVAARRFDNRLSFYGLGFADFLILVHLSQSPDQKMRRVDLAEKIGLTASGITRQLLPMEKIGLVEREESEVDARVSYVKLAEGGKRLLADGLENAEVLAQTILPPEKIKGMEKFSELLAEIGNIVVY